MSIFFQDSLNEINVSLYNHATVLVGGHETFDATLNNSMYQEWCMDAWTQLKIVSYIRYGNNSKINTAVW